jgi:hypothetical protein
MALQLPTTARPVQTQPRTARALPDLRRGAPQRPNRARKHESRTAAGDLPQCRHNLANPMIESSGRHGHFDPRWHTNSSRPPRALVPAAEDGGPSIQNWENEGGRYARPTRPTPAPGSSGTRSSAATSPGGAAMTSKHSRETVRLSTGPLEPVEQNREEVARVGNRSSARSREAVAGSRVRSSLVRHRS